MRRAPNRLHADSQTAPGQWATLACPSAGAPRAAHATRGPWQAARRRVVRGLVATLGAIALVALAAPADAARTVYRGQWQCDDRGTIQPLGGIELQLWRRGNDWFPVEWVGGIDDRGFANPDGTFTLTASDGEDTHFVRMALRDAAGVRLKDFWGINDWSVDSGGVRNNVAEHNFGGLLFSTPGQSHKCAVWRGFQQAHQDFRTVTGVNPPSGGLLINADAVTAGVPFTPHTSVMWPGGFPVGYGGGGDDSITRHEFGHVIRHGYDGDAGHFLGDVVTHNYLRNHEPCLKTGPGFAFNEGWAEYWARDYTPAPACPGRAADDYEVEGNVAAALAEIEARCYGGRRASMVDILRANLGVIHSFAEFQARVVCPAPFVVVLLPVRPATTVVVLSPSQRAEIARAQVKALDAQLRRLRAGLRTAERRRAAGLPACVRTPCNAALRRATLPAVMRTQIALAELVRRTVDDQDTVTEQQALSNLDVATADKRMKAIERTNRISAARVSADGIRDALSAGRRVFARDKSRATRRLRSRLVARLATFRKAQKSATGAPGVVLDQAVVDRIRKVPPRTFPTAEPLPTPTVAPRAVSTLTLTCPPNGSKAGDYLLTGTLSPMRAGVPVELHVTSPNATATVVQTTTDAAGAFTAPQSMTQGTWTFFARWAGDANTQPDDSPSCQTVIT